MPQPLKRLLAPSRVRKPPPTGFGWIDRRFVNGGHLSKLTQPESLLYFFLCAVSDGEGLSFYGDRRLCAELHLTPPSLDRARNDLDRRGLVLYRHPLYQVLPLPAEQEPPPNRISRAPTRIDSDEGGATLPRPISAFLRPPKQA